MTLRSSCVFIGLMVGLSAVASANKVSVAGSQYGDPTGHAPVSCSSPTCIFPAGVTMTEQNFDFSDAPDYEAFYFAISGSISNFTLTLTGDANFISDDTVTNEYFGFGAYCPGGDVPPCNAFLQTPDASDGNEKQVSFSVSGSGDGLVFFAVEPETAGFDTDTNTLVLNNHVTATITPNASAVPEPRLLPIFGLGVVGLVFLRRLRSAKLA